MEMPASWGLQIEGKAGEDKRRGLMTERFEILSKLEKSQSFDVMGGMRGSDRR